jgi:beta-lactamase regulating signal transducer with metallopeptidase domain
MSQVINTIITGLNEIGRGFWDYAAAVFVQASLLIVLLLILDFVLRKHVRAVFRYCLWMLLFVKLVLPASFTLPTGIGYWLGDYFPVEVSTAIFTPHTKAAVPMMQIDEVVPMVNNTSQRYVLDTQTMNERMPAGVELESINWQGLVFSGWLVGMLVLSISVVRRFCYVRRLIANSRSPIERSVEMLEECRRRMGIRRNIELRLTGQKLSPAVCGLFKPTILMPATLLQKLSREKLSAVLIHELAHIKRGDAWVHLLQTILQIVYFYNPLVWIANTMVRRVREQAVDEMVLVTLRPKTKNYSNMLIDIAEMAFWRPNFSLSIIGVVESKKALERRINHMLTRPVPKSSKLGILGLTTIFIIGAILLPMGRGSIAQAVETNKTIVPGVRIGDYTLGMSKDDVLEKLGEPFSIRIGGQRYSLNDLRDDLPRRYIMSYSDFSFQINEDTVTGITVRSPLYKFTNGLGVGDSEEKIKQAFGSNFQLEEYESKDLLNYQDKGIQFEILNKDKTVAEIDVYQAKGIQQSDRHPSQDLSTIVRQAATDSRISFKLTTPDDFKAIVGRPTREWKDGDDIICLEYPSITARFFGKQNVDIPYTLVSLSCEGRGIDIGQNRPVVLRNEGDLEKFGTFWGYSGVDLSRLDLSKKGDLLKTMSFDSRTVWPKPNHLPPDFDPRAVMEWGKYPGLGIKQLHERGITGKGVHVAIIDQPLLLDHIEYKDQLASYTDIQTGDAGPSMHGPAVASLLVGKTCGVAPGAILHFWAEPSWKMDYKYRCIALEQIIQYNKGKEKSEQIRVVSVSKGFNPDEPNLDRWKTLLEQAKQSGIFVVHCSSMGFGAGCRFLEDSDNPASYRLCAFYTGGPTYHEPGCFFTPIDHRTTASPAAKDVYTFWVRGGLSWGAPYYAGVVALGMQVNPNLRPDQIEKLLYDSGWDFQRGKLINPVGFVEAAREAG